MVTIIYGNIEIQIHDTYISLDFVLLITLTIGPLTFMIFLILAITKKFKTIETNIGLAVAIFFMILITIGFLKLENNYLHELLIIDPQNFTDIEKIIDKIIYQRNWTWGFLGFWIICIVLLTFKTIKIWIKEASVSPKD